MAGGLAFDTGAQSQDNFGGVMLLNPLDEQRDFKVFRPHASERADGAAEHVVVALEAVAALDCPDIGDAFNNADLLGVAGGAGADFAAGRCWRLAVLLGEGEVVAVGAEGELALDVVEGGLEKLQFFRGLEQGEGDPLRAARAKTRQFAELAQQFFQRWGDGGHALRF